MALLAIWTHRSCYLSGSSMFPWKAINLAAVFNRVPPPRWQHQRLSNVTFHRWCIIVKWHRCSLSETMPKDHQRRHLYIIICTHQYQQHPFTTRCEIAAHFQRLTTSEANVCLLSKSTPVHLSLQSTLPSDSFTCFLLTNEHRKAEFSVQHRQPPIE